MWTLSCVWNLVPWLGIEARTLCMGAWVLATGPPGKPLALCFLIKGLGKLGSSIKACLWLREGAWEQCSGQVVLEWHRVLGEWSVLSLVKFLGVSVSSPPECHLSCLSDSGRNQLLGDTRATHHLDPNMSLRTPSPKMTFCWDDCYPFPSHFLSLLKTSLFHL